MPLIVPVTAKFPVPVAIVVAPVKVTASPRVSAVLFVLRLPDRFNVPVPSVVRLPTVTPPLRLV